MKTRNSKKSILSLIAGGFLLTSGCLPENFWVDLFGTLAAETITTVASDQIDNVLNPDSGD